jgi:hypothetical protein
MIRLDTDIRSQGLTYSSLLAAEQGPMEAVLAQEEEEGENAAGGAALVWACFRFEACSPTMIPLWLG